MFDWLPWAISAGFLLAIAALASVAFRGGPGHGQHIDWEAAAAEHGAARAIARHRVAEGINRAVYIVLALAVTGGTIAMLVAAFTVEAGAE